MRTKVVIGVMLYVLLFLREELELDPHLRSRIIKPTR